MRVERHERIGLGIVGSAAPRREGVRNKQQVPDDTLDAVRGKCEQVYAVVVLEAALFDLLWADEEHITPAMDTTIAVGERIESRIVLVVAAHRRQPKRIRIVFRRIFAETVEQQEVRLPRSGRPDSFAPRGRLMEAAGHTDAGIVTL